MKLIVRFRAKLTYDCIVREGEICGKGLENDCSGFILNREFKEGFWNINT